MSLLPQKANTEGNNETLGDRSALPAGDYVAQIVKTEFKPTKKKDGHYLALQLKVLEGDCTGRVLFTNLNLDNPNKVAVEIANKELNSICEACDLEDVEDSDELLNIPMLVTVKVTPADAKYPEGNEITTYAAADEVEGGPVEDPVKAEEEPAEEAPAATPGHDVEAPAAEGGLPWEK